MKQEILFEPDLYPVSYIKDAQPGMFTYYRTIFRDKGEWETAFAIREETRRIKALEKNPTFEIRTGLITYLAPTGNIVHAGVVILSVNTITCEFYETWFNYHQTSGGEMYFRDLATQDRIMISFWGDSREIESQKMIRNSLQETFQRWLTVIEKTEPWSMDEFDMVQDDVCVKFPNVRSLWESFDS